MTSTGLPVNQQQNIVSDSESEFLDVDVTLDQTIESLSQLSISTTTTTTTVTIAGAPINQTGVLTRSQARQLGITVPSLYDITVDTKSVTKSFVSADVKESVSQSGSEVKQPTAQPLPLASALVYPGCELIEVDFDVMAHAKSESSCHDGDEDEEIEGEHAAAHVETEHEKRLREEKE